MDGKTVKIPIEGILDLHAFKPNEVRELVPEYLSLCRERKILEIRIVHGKGTGTLRKIVYSALQQIPEVISFGPADETEGGWGATVVRLAPWRA